MSLKDFFGPLEAQRLEDEKKEKERTAPVTYDYRATYQNKLAAMAAEREMSLGSGIWQNLFGGHSLLGCGSVQSAGGFLGRCPTCGRAYR